MEPQTYQFIGDATTYFGLIGVTATFGILYWCFRSYWNSPLRK